MPRLLPFRWFHLQEINTSNSHARPLEWRESGSNPLSVTLVLNIVQQLLESEPVSTQHTWITVLASSPSVRLARLGEPDGSVTLRVQGTSYEHLARMLYNAPLHRTEQWLRELAKQHWITLHWVVIWVALSAIRMEYVASGKDSSFHTNLVATAIYYLLWGVLAVGSTALEMWLFPSLEFGVERLAAMYHETEFARLWDQRSGRRCQSLREAAAREWGCSESNVHAHQLHIRTSFSAVRTIANRLREEKGRIEEAPLEVDMRLPLLQNITSTSKAEEDFKLLVHVEHELRRGLFKRVPLSRSSYSATGNASWRQGVRLDRPGEARLAQQGGELPSEPQSRGPSSPDGIARLDSRAGGWVGVGGSPRGASHRADQQGVALQGMSVGDNAV
ncbi:hypothetical protein COCOBI_07-5980 [Coccomyxa sp. Obi]|nr:hypothetical protein COCOBI_07-5980 [Coccomyxa sp. Obi]